MSTKSKGAALEHLVETWLQMQGYVVHRAAAAGVHRFGSFYASKSNDIFGCIDLLAIRRDGTRAFQCTTAQNRAARRKKIEKHAEHWPSQWEVAVVVHDWERVASNKPGVSRTQHYLRIERVNHACGGWCPQESVEIDVKAIEAWRKVQGGVVI